MRGFRYIILLFIIFFNACKTSDELSPADQDLLASVKNLIPISIQLEKDGKYAHAIQNNVDATNLLKAMNTPDYKRLYFFYRSQAKLANKINKDELAVDFADSALHYLHLVPPSNLKSPKALEEFTTKKFLARYLRLSGDMERSFKLTKSLIEQVDIESEYYPQLKNQLALSNLEVGNYKAAETHFRDLLKISSLDSLRRHFYIKGLARSLHYQDRGGEALDVIQKALQWLPNSAESQFHFHALRDAGQYNVTWGSASDALTYFQAALDLELPMNTNSEYFDLYRLQSLAYAKLSQSVESNAFERKFILSRSNHEYMGKRIDALFARSWLSAKQAQMQHEQDAQRQQQITTQLILIYSLVLVVVAFLLWRGLRLFKTTRSKVSQITRQRMS